VKAIEDALRTFPADEVILVTLPDEDAAWLERGSAKTALNRFSLPVTHLVVENYSSLGVCRATGGCMPMSRSRGRFGARAPGRRSISSVEDRQRPVVLKGGASSPSSCSSSLSSSFWRSGAFSAADASSETAIDLTLGATERMALSGSSKRSLCLATLFQQSPETPLKFAVVHTHSYYPALSASSHRASSPFALDSLTEARYRRIWAETVKSARSY
jgi:hypothetical protein